MKIIESSEFSFISFIMLFIPARNKNNQAPNNKLKFCNVFMYSSPCLKYPDWFMSDDIGEDDKSKRINSKEIAE